VLFSLIFGEDGEGGEDDKPIGQLLNPTHQPFSRLFCFVNN